MEEKKNGSFCSFVRKSRFCKQAIASFGFRALEALFVAEKSFVVNQNDKKIIEEDSSFHLTYQTLISVHWWLVIEQICKQTVTISVFWALEALFVAEKSFVVNQNDWKFIEEDSSFHLTYQTLISDHWLP